jgi:type II secretory pathway pseudopilin PulG
MPDQANVFEDAVIAPITQEPVKEPSQSTPYEDLLKSIQNEQGQQKYDSLPKALEGLQHAQQYIPQLRAELQSKEQELATMRSELEKRSSVEEVVSRLTAQQKDRLGSDTPSVASGLDEQAVLQLVQQALGQAKQQDQAQSNTAQVQQALSSMYGEKSREVVEQKAKELGTTPAELGKLASQNPAMVLALFNAKGSPSVKPTTGSAHLSSTYQTERPALERPVKSLLSGATSKDQAAYMKRIKDEVYAKYNITQ